MGRGEVGGRVLVGPDLNDSGDQSDQYYTTTRCTNRVVKWQEIVDRFAHAFAKREPQSYSQAEYDQAVRSLRLEFETEAERVKTMHAAAASREPPIEILNDNRRSEPVDVSDMVLFRYLC